METIQLTDDRLTLEQSMEQSVRFTAVLSKTNLVKLGILLLKKSKLNWFSCPNYVKRYLGANGVHSTMLHPDFENRTYYDVLVFEAFSAYVNNLYKLKV